MNFLPLFLLLFSCVTVAAAADNSHLTSQQQNFLAAEQALHEGALKRYRQLREKLGDYPLIPYLEYQQLRRRLAHASPTEIEAFLERYSATPLATRLQQAWIRILARSQRWPDLIAAYRPTQDVALKCSYRRALYESGAHQAALADLQQLWLSGHSQPRACDPLFAAWYESGAISSQLAWQRFTLAMANNQLRLARYLRRFLPAAERSWADLWISVHRQPNLIEVATRFSLNHPLRNTILMHGIKRMADKDPQRALKIWEQDIKPYYPFTEREIATAQRRLAMALAVRGYPEALARLAEIDEQNTDRSLREWRIRAALSQRNWYAVLAWIYQLDETQQQTTRWQYWQGRALEALQQRRQAEEIYLSLAGRRSYYGLLAADRLDLPYRLGEQSSQTKRLDSASMEEYPGIVRARELLSLGRIVAARREWYYATRDMAEWQLQDAARLAQEWGWHDRAITTMARTRHRDDLALRFPLAHRQQITAQAAANGIEAAYAFAIIRQESAFTPDARSPAGALGLMQVLPRTARHIATRMGIPFTQRRELLDIDINLQLGMAYLGQMMRHFNGHPMLAAAAYNAGQYRVDKWIRRDHITAADIWLETIPVAETRNYVRNVLLFTAIYQQRLGQRPRALHERLTPVTPPGMILAETEKQKLPPSGAH